MEDVGKLKNKKQIAEEFQIGKYGVSGDYLTHLSHILQLDGKFRAEPELVALVVDNIKKFPSYTEYMKGHYEIQGFNLRDFLMPESSKIIQRLDEIASEIRSMPVDDPSLIDWDRLEKLWEESKTLIGRE